MKRTLILIFAAGLAGSLMAVPADAAKLCKDIKPGEGRVRDCLQKNIRKLSNECKTRQEKMRDRLELRNKASDTRKG